MAIVERSLYCTQEDARWLFYQSGVPMQEEDKAGYEARRMKDRLNEERIAGFLNRLGARPWEEDFYALPEQKCLVIIRENPPQTVSKRSVEEVVPGATL
jgi:hypothetical protein